MKNILCFTIAICIALGSLTAQQNYFIAGDTSGVLYYDIDPDYRLDVGIFGETYGIDINLDGTDDFFFEAIVGWSHYYDYWEIKVLSYGSNKVAYSHKIDWRHMGIGLDQGDTINNVVLFTGETVFLIDKQNGIDPFPTYYYSWNPDDYIPVCLKTESSSECIYGWIKVYDVTYGGITLDSYAVDIIPTTVYVSPPSRDFIIYPNPAKQEINIPVDGFAIGEVVIYTLSGQMVFAVTPENKTIDISTLQPGMYIVEVTVEGRKIRSKLLVQR
jgi:hypothetical protein